MYSASIQNANGWVMLLTGNEPVYQIIDIQGLNPPSAQINDTTIVGMDGARFNSARLNTRNIVLTVKINGDVERNRLNLYDYFRTKEWCRFYYSNGSLDVFIDGYVESVECGLFSNAEQAQISIICEQPYFLSLQEIVTDISNTLGLFVFPFSINHNEPIPISDYVSNRATNVYAQSATGARIIVDFFGSVNEIEIQNITNGQGITVQYSFVDGDNLTIDTNFGEKGAWLTRQGAITNLFTAIQSGSKFVQLDAGSNLLTYLADAGASDDAVRIRILRRDAYRGV